MCHITEAIERVRESFDKKKLILAAAAIQQAIDEGAYIGSFMCLSVGALLKRGSISCFDFENTLDVINRLIDDNDRLESYLREHLIEPSNAEKFVFWRAVIKRINTL